MTEEVYSVRNIHYSDLKVLLSWRNHSEIRKYMISQHEISVEEHLAWFEGIKIDSNRCQLMVERDGVAMGYVQFKDIHCEYTEWGFYVAPGSPKGSGSALAKVALTYAFNSLGLDKVEGKALITNQASIKLHLKCGFEKQIEPINILCDDERRKEMYRFVLDKSSWQKLNSCHETI